MTYWNNHKLLKKEHQLLLDAYSAVRTEPAMMHSCSVPRLRYPETHKAADARATLEQLRDRLESSGMSFFLSDEEMKSHGKSGLISQIETMTEHLLADYSRVSTLLARAQKYREGA